MTDDSLHKLIPMTDFVIEYYANEGYADLQTLNLMNNYAVFLKKPLLLGMFVPVDAQGNILKEPKNYAAWKTLEHNQLPSSPESDTPSFREYRIYQEAERRCFFHGFTIAYNGYSVVRITASYDESIELSFNKSDMMSQTFKDVESLLHFENIYLNSAAVKQLGISDHTP
ncbi:MULTISPECIES: hypothetical protein [Chryseobacterium]|uniref:Uncharacterized protein n=1 Tax=Chryseobacterium camelliae TaxID=1265445 RepID=A0ABU0TGC9_9FLAO|nr:MULTISPECIES: hypothetical protein [Chryseobacterium]MDT3406085.1 hypothetical protein [Pseudacidovorax intermedius]MDQ1096114.1 hypothetical protein [Chryseobacterium camelliae]MDQ1100050.1 hypothetical protein [Chryseobacterium sp. SORGH_AS_1048]MDR6087393.1 hypothetical protein [Chryseobacterium sp. SORGH_AS_0909]MDR6131768.1 hypothetical protein [Chryseobacterium sp. SORGH_AS_1175]